MRSPEMILVIDRFLDRLVKSFSLGRFIVVILVARVFALFMLPTTPSPLAPDEGSYASLAFWVAGNKDFDDYPGGVGLYNTSKTLILPAAALVRLGFDELTAVRIMSIVFGILGVYFFARITFLVLRIRHLQDLNEARSQRLTILVLTLFAFLPSYFLWSILGLRESASKAMILASVFLLLRLRELDLSRRNIPQSVLAISLPILTLALAFGARRQTAFVFVIFFCLSILLMSRRHNSLSQTGVILLGTVLGLIFSTTPTTVASVKFDWAPVVSETKSPAPVVSETKSPAPVVSETKSPAPLTGRTDGAVARCEREGDRISTSSGELVCTTKTVTKKVISLEAVVSQAPILTLDEIEYRRGLNRLNAETALAEPDCTNYSQLSIQNVICNARELPYRLTGFLIRPFPIIDSGSLSNNLASAENLIWILLLIAFAHNLRVSIKERFKLEVVVPTTLFIVFFSSLAALYEGNLGTAFRHKSTILWGLLLVITIGINSNWRKSEEEYQEENPRYAS